MMEYVKSQETAEGIRTGYSILLDLLAVSTQTKLMGKSTPSMHPSSSTEPNHNGNSNNNHNKDKNTSKDKTTTEESKTDTGKNNLQ